MSAPTTPPAPAQCLAHKKYSVHDFLMHKWHITTCCIGCKVEGLCKTLGKELWSLRRLWWADLGSRPELKLGCRSPEDVWEHSVIYTYIRCFIRRMSTGYRVLFVWGLCDVQEKPHDSEPKRNPDDTKPVFPKVCSREPSSQETWSCKIKILLQK